MLKLTLDLDTLKALIGGDTPFQLEIREGIIQTFARLHLKALINEDMISGLRAEIRGELSTMRESFRKEVVGLVAEHFPVVQKPHDPWKGVVYAIDKTNPKYLQLCHSLEKRAREVSVEAVNEILTALSEKLQKTIEYRVKSLEHRIAAEVKQQLTATFEQRVQREISRRVAALAASPE